MPAFPHAAPRIFISYNHEQQTWVKNDLVPLLEAGGAEVIVDFREFEAGKRVVGQMDDAQDKAQITVCILTPAYSASDYCMHELNLGMERQEEGHTVIPVMREHCAPYECLGDFDTILHVNLIDARNDDQWKLLFDSCDVRIGTTATQWLEAREEISMHLGRGESVNLVIRGKGIAWRELLKQISKDGITCCNPIDLSSGGANTRQALVEEILHGCGIEAEVPKGKEDLVVLDREISRSPRQHILVFTHFDMVKERLWYGNSELFGAIRNLMTDKRKLVLLIQSRQHFVHLLPKDNPLSSINNIVTVELQGCV